MCEKRLAKETYIYEKRPTYMKRAIYKCGETLTHETRVKRDQQKRPLFARTDPQRDLYV